MLFGTPASLDVRNSLQLLPDHAFDMPETQMKSLVAVLLGNLGRDRSITTLRRRYFQTPTSVHNGPIPVGDYISVEITILGSNTGQPTPVDRDNDPIDDVVEQILQPPLSATFRTLFVRSRQHFDKNVEKSSPTLRSPSLAQNSLPTLVPLYRCQNAALCVR